MLFSFKLLWDCMGLTIEVILHYFDCKLLPKLLTFMGFLKKESKYSRIVWGQFRSWDTFKLIRFYSELNLDCKVVKKTGVGIIFSSGLIHSFYSGIVGRSSVHGNTVWTNSWNRNPVYSNMISIGKHGERTPPGAYCAHYIFWQILCKVQSKTTINTLFEIYFSRSQQSSSHIRCDHKKTCNPCQMC